MLRDRANLSGYIGQNESGIMRVVGNSAKTFYDIALFGALTKPFQATAETRLLQRMLLDVPK